MAMMKAAILNGIRNISLDNIEVPEPGKDEVLVRVKSVGVCGSDIHYYNHGRIGDFVVEKPLILGHECSGEVVGTGPEVKYLKPGDRVALEPGIPCRKCRFCKIGRYNLCPDVSFMATPPVDGAFCEYVVSSEDFAFKVPDNMSFDEAALIEPLAVGVYACERANLKLNQRVVVLGAGPIGLVTLQAARAYGAGKVIVTDVNNFRLAKARELGATEVVNVLDRSGGSLSGAVGEGADVVFETSGNPSAVQETLRLARRGGKVVVIGLPPQAHVEYDIVSISSKELDILGIFRYANVYPQGIELVARGLVDLKKLITHHYGLEEIVEALEVADKQKDKAIKVIVHP